MPVLNRTLLKYIEEKFGMHTDELFLVNRSVLRVDLREGSMYVKKGQIFVVPKCLEHMTHAYEDAN